jgi:hypothetical protein
VSVKHPALPRLDAMKPWLRILLALETAGWDTHHSTSHHQQLATLCSRVFKDMEKQAGKEKK